MEKEMLQFLLIDFSECSENGFEKVQFIKIRMK